MRVLFLLCAAALLFSASGLPVQEYFASKVDHFDPLHNREWQQTFYLNDTFWKGAETAAPVFLCMGGEGPALDSSVVSSSVHCNDAVDLLPESGALLVALEHRYYTCHNRSACPVAELTSIGQYKYFSVEQALEDAATFHVHITKRFNLTKNNKWITFGGSYPGILASFARLKYPHLFWGAVASSAPVQAELNMRGYNNILSRAYAVESVGGSGTCRDKITRGHAAIGDLLLSPQGRATVTSLFGLQGGSLAQEAAQRRFCGNGVAEFPAQGNDPVCQEPACNIEKICKIMTTIDDPVEGLVEVRKQQAAARVVKNGPEDADLWSWQVCTEFGFLQTCEVGSECMFTQGLVTLESAFEEACHPYNITDISMVERGIELLNNRYGGWELDSPNLLWVNGEVDPWIANSPTKLTPAQVRHGQQVIFVPGASHHAWTHPSLASDQPTVVEARKQIRAVVNGWLQQAGKDMMANSNRPSLVPSDNVLFSSLRLQ